MGKKKDDAAAAAAEKKQEERKPEEVAPRMGGSYVNGEREPDPEPPAEQRGADNNGNSGQEMSHA